MNKNLSTSFDSISIQKTQDNTPEKNLMSSNDIGIDFYTRVASFLKSKYSTVSLGSINLNFKIFSIKQELSITLEKYIKRIILYSECDENTVIHALALLNKFCNKHIEEVCLGPLNVNLLFFVSFLISVKLLEDDIFNNQFYAEVCGIPQIRLNILESVFIEHLDYRLHIDIYEFNKYKLNFNSFKLAE